MSREITGLVNGIKCGHLTSFLFIRNSIYCNVFFPPNLAGLNQIAKHFETLWVLPWGFGKRTLVFIGAVLKDHVKIIRCINFGNDCLIIFNSNQPTRIPTCLCIDTLWKLYPQHYAPHKYRDRGWTALSIINQWRKQLLYRIVVTVQGWAKDWALGCVNPAYWVLTPSGRGGRVHATCRTRSLAQICTCTGTLHIKYLTHTHTP